MRKYLFYLLLAIATCIITGCSDNYAEEPNQPKTMTHEVTQSEALQYLNKITPDFKIPPREVRQRGRYHQLQVRIVSVRTPLHAPMAR